MKKLVLILFVLLGFNSYGFDYPYVYIQFTSPVPAKMYCDDTARVSMYISFSNLRTYENWILPAGITLNNLSGNCPAVPYGYGFYGMGGCTINLTINSGHCPSKPITGNLLYHIMGEDGRWPHVHSWDYFFPSPPLNIQVIPHALSMNLIALQSATINHPFTYDLKKSIKFFDENKNSGYKAQAEVQPLEQDGLKFDEPSFSIVGTPTRIGMYHFKVSAKNVYSKAAPVELNINVRADPAKKPQFKIQNTLVSALANEKFNLNLMNLIEDKPRFMVTDQLTFQITERRSNANWIDISPDDSTKLVGTPTLDLAGRYAEIALVAVSNAGGDSEPFILKIPIIYTPENKPVLNYFSMKKPPLSMFNDDLSSYINDPTNDPNAQIIIDKVLPEASWITISNRSATMLEGIIPFEATGRKYQITLRANTEAGGSSDPITVPLEIMINKEYTPRLTSNDLTLPIMYPGQNYIYDFVEYAEIVPEFAVIPFEVSLDEHSQNPAWLRVENNKLIADLVPEDVDPNLTINIVITNTPGGKSDVIKLPINIMK